MRYSSLACAVTGLLVCGAAVCADEITLGASRDNTLYEYVPEEGYRSNGIGPSFYVGLTNLLTIRRGLLRFDLSTLPADIIITDVRLELFAFRTNGGGLNIGLHRTLEDWGEGMSDAGFIGGAGAPAEPGDATWAHQFFDTDLWATEGGTFAPTASSTTSVSGIGRYTWSSTPQMLADVRGWYDRSVPNFGWVLASPEQAPGVAKGFDSREGATESTRPRLIITFVPAPGAGMVLGMALIAAARRRRP
jgi:hypothetical protein